MNTALPFGLCSAPKITSIADVLEKMRCEAHFFHYLDDFDSNSPQSDECQKTSENLRKLLQLFSKLGVPVAEERK